MSIIVYNEDWSKAQYIKTPYMKCLYGLEGNTYKFLRLSIDDSEANQIFLKKCLQHLACLDINPQQLINPDSDTESLRIRFDIPHDNALLFSQTKEQIKISRETIRPNCFLKAMIRIKHINSFDDLEGQPSNTGRTHQIEALQLLVKE